MAWYSVSKTKLIHVRYTTELIRYLTLCSGVLCGMKRTEE